MFGFGSKKKKIIGLFKGFNFKKNSEYIYEFQNNGDLIVLTDGYAQSYKWDLVKEHLLISENGKVIQDNPIKLEKDNLTFLWSAMGEEDWTINRIPKNMEESYRYKKEYVAPTLVNGKQVSIDELTNEHRRTITNYLVMGKKISAIKYLMDATGLQLAEAKNMIENSGRF